MYLVPWTPPPGILHPSKEHIQGHQKEHFPFMPWWGSNCLLTSVVASSEGKQAQAKIMESLLGSEEHLEHCSPGQYLSASFHLCLRQCLPVKNPLASVSLTEGHDFILKEQTHSDSGRMYVKGKEISKLAQTGKDWHRIGK